MEVEVEMADEVRVVLVGVFVLCGLYDVCGILGKRHRLKRRVASSDFTLG